MYFLLLKKTDHTLSINYDNLFVTKSLKNCYSRSRCNIRLFVHKMSANLEVITRDLVKLEQFIFIILRRN